MKTRSTVCTFLRHGDELLLLHRGLHKKIAPGMWSGVGGHVERNELNDPCAASLRELQEEAGIAEAMIRSLTLRYITVRDAGGLIDQGYLFFGELIERIVLPECDEGMLQWMPMAAVPGLAMSFSIKQSLLRWLENGDEDGVWLFGVNHDNDAGSWVKL